MVSFTCESNVNPAFGDNFYLAKYGILVEQAPNTCVACSTKDAHCTTLANPVPGSHNYGVSFDRPVKLTSAARNLEKKAASNGNNLDDLGDVDDEDDEKIWMRKRVLFAFSRTLLD
jgi:hypothetical protein